MSKKLTTDELIVYDSFFKGYVNMAGHFIRGSQFPMKCAVNGVARGDKVLIATPKKKDVLLTKYMLKRILEARLKGCEKVNK